MSDPSSTPSHHFLLNFSPLLPGLQKTNFHSKHGVILSCTFDIIDLEDWGNVSEVRSHLDLVEHALAGEKYGFVKNEAKPKELTGNQGMQQLWDELVREMES